MDDRFAKLPLDVACRSDLSSTAKVVYAVLADRMGGNDHCWPGQRRIAKDSGVSARTANRAVKELQTQGLIEVMPGRLSGPRAQRSSCYRIPNVEDSNTLNVDKSSTLKKCERSHSDHVDGEESNTSTLNKLTRNQTKKPDPSTRPNRRESMDSWQSACEHLEASSPLRSDAFRAAWADWWQHRVELRKRLTASTIRQQLADLEKHGEIVAVKAIQESIRNGWQGLFPANLNGQKDGKPDPSKIRTGDISKYERRVNHV